MKIPLTQIGEPVLSDDGIVLEASDVAKAILSPEILTTMTTGQLIDAIESIQAEIQYRNNSRWRH